MLKVSPTVHWYKQYFNSHQGGQEETLQFPKYTLAGRLHECNDYMWLKLGKYYSILSPSCHLQLYQKHYSDYYTSMYT